MNINKTEADTHQPVLIDKEEEFFQIDKRGLGEQGKEVDNFLSISEVAAGQFSDDKGVAGHLAIQQ